MCLSLTTREMQVKTAMRYYSTSIKTAKKLIMTTANAGEDVERRGLSGIASGMEKGTATLEKILTVSP